MSFVHFFFQSRCKFYEYIVYPKNRNISYAMKSFNCRESLYFYLKCMSIFQRTPSMVTSINDKQIIQISAGGEFNVAMDSEHLLWVWGKNEFGQVKKCRQKIMRKAIFMLTVMFKSNGSKFKIYLDRQWLIISWNSKDLLFLNFVPLIYRTMVYVPVK